FACRRGVNIQSVLKGFLHSRVATKIGHNAELYLRVVGRDEQVLTVAWHKSLTYLASTFGAYRYVLQVRVGRAQSAGSGYCLVKRSMHTAIQFANKLRQRIHVRRF